MDCFKLCLGLLLLTTLEANSKNFYFSSSSGSDHYTSEQAQSPVTPWKTINKLNESMDYINPGDSILFKRGDIFSGQINLTRSGTENREIVFSTFGDGPVPVITGESQVTGWKNYDGNIWVADCPFLGSTVTSFMIDYKPQQIGRYPNSDEPNSGYLNIDSHTGSSNISSSSLLSSTDWTGADAVVRTRRWILDWMNIVSHQGNSISFEEPASFEFIDNFGFFIQGHIRTLDIDGEWYYDASQKKMYLFHSTTPNDLVTTATGFQSTFTATEVDFVKIHHIEFKGSNSANINFNKSDHIEISNCTISFSGNDGMNFTRCNYITIEENTIIESNNNAVEVTYSTNLIVKSNEIRSTGLRVGMGDYSYHQYTALFLKADNIHCEANTIDSTGYIGIYYLGDSITIRKNHINHFCMTLEDGGGLYTYNKDRNLHSYRLIESNIILNGLGASDGTSNPDKSLTFGIFFDFGSDHIIARNNTIAHCAGYGIFNHFANHITLTGNTVYDNFKQLVFTDTHHEYPAHITNCQVTNNVFFSKTEEQTVAEFRLSSEVSISDLGLFDNNYYCRPLNDNHTIQVLRYSSNSTSEYVLEQLDLVSWKSIYNLDLNSSVSPYKLPVYSFKNLVGSNLIFNSTFDGGVSDWHCYSRYKNCNMFWESNKLENGCLGVNFSELSGETDGILHAIGSFGSFAEGENYILRFSMVSTHPGKKIRVSMRNWNPPYNEVASEKFVTVSDAMQEYELFFTPSSSEDRGTINFIFEEDEETYWIDNVELHKANLEVAQTEDSILFVYNPGAENMIISDDHMYIDARGDKYSNINLLPFGSLLLLKTMKDSLNVSHIPVNELKLILYPNPVSNTLQISTNQSGTKTIHIVDLSGRIRCEMDTETEEFSIDISSLTSGIYLLRLVGAQGAVTSRFIVI